MKMVQNNLQEKTEPTENCRERSSARRVTFYLPWALSNFVFVVSPVTSVPWREISLKKRLEITTNLEISFHRTIVFIVMIEARTCEDNDEPSAHTIILTILCGRSVGANVLVRNSCCVFEDLRDMIMVGKRDCLLTLSLPSIPDTFWFHLQ